MEHEEVLGLLEEVMQEHHPEWVLSSRPEYFTVICSCGDRVKYNEHLKELLRARVVANKKEARTDDEV